MDVRVGLLGLGTVGAATVQTLQRNQADIRGRAGSGIVVTHAVVRDLDKVRDCDTSDIQLSTDADSLINNPDVDIIVELQGGIEPAKSYVLRAIENGKHVITANKALLALHGNTIFDAARKHQVDVAFEAAVAGGIPIIKTLREALAGNRIESIVGILNGTSNYILSKMTAEGGDFAAVLMQAQELGYAESDPGFDIEGMDVAHKITILAAIAFGTPLNFSDCHIEGITHITPLDIRYAKELGFVIKHVGIAKRCKDNVELRVHPVLIAPQAPLASVHGVMNAVQVTADALGESVYYGAGAGGAATASAVVADLVDMVRLLTADPEHRVPHLAFHNESLSALPIKPINEVISANYLRLQLQDTAGSLAQIATILAEHEISIESLLQKPSFSDSKFVPVVIITKAVPEANLKRAINAMENLAAVRGGVLQLRLL